MSHVDFLVCMLASIDQILLESISLAAALPTALEHPCPDGSQVRKSSRGDVACDKPSFKWAHQFDLQPSRNHDIISQQARHHLFGINSTDTLSSSSADTLIPSDIVKPPMIVIFVGLCYIATGMYMFAPLGYPFPAQENVLGMLLEFVTESGNG